MRVRLLHPQEGHQDLLGPEAMAFVAQVVGVGAGLQVQCQKGLHRLFQRITRWPVRHCSLIPVTVITSLIEWRCFGQLPVGMTLLGRGLQM